MLDYFQKFQDLFVYQDLFLIFLSIIVGLVIGAEREYKNKTAGLRTLMLVCLGSCIFTILSIKIGFENPDRLAANIITGIGFLGAGAIFKDDNKINGITTACTIWVTAALGMSIGSGHVFLALLSMFFVLIVLWQLVSLERWIDKTNNIKIYKITTLFNENNAKYFEKIFTDFNLKYSIVSQIKNEEKHLVNWRIEGSKKKHAELVEQLLKDKLIRQIEF